MLRLCGRKSNTSSNGAVSDSKPEYIVRSVDLAPDGYPKLATFLDSEDQFSTYRRFGYLSSRLILEKQDDLRQLEQELERADKRQVKLCAEELKTRRCIEGQAPTEQHFILKKIEDKFHEYCTILRNTREVAAYNKPTTREWKAVKTWLSNVNPLYPAEQHFADFKEDLITLRSGREHAQLESAVDGSFNQSPAYSANLPFVLPWLSGDPEANERKRKQPIGTDGSPKI
ncbi:MAG: hypothetical protein Q9227_005133 [Pyrenula ochraceoflavens]